MEQQSRTLIILATSLGLGIFFDYLFFDKQIGISAFIFSTAAILTLARLYPEKFQKNGWLTAISFLMLVFSIIPFIRANDFLIFINVLAVIGLGGILVAELTSQSIGRFAFRDYLSAVILLPLQFIASALKMIGSAIKLSPALSKHEKTRKVAQGILMAVPVVFIFTILLSSADMVFSKIIAEIFNFNISDKIIGQIIVIVGATCASLGVLGYISSPIKIASELKDQPAQESKKITEIVVFLSIIALLFATFIGIQVAYLFGGTANISEFGFTYAEYAHRGFTELVIVAILTLIIILAAEKYVHAATKNTKAFLIPAGILTFETLVLIYSAWMRLSIYQDAYGFTTLRFFVSAFIIIMFAVFLLLGIKLALQKQDNFFAVGTIALVLGAILCINLINPDSFIVKQNIDNYKKTGRLDSIYLGRLSSDAVPALMDAQADIHADTQSPLEFYDAETFDRWQRQNKPWQSFNLSRRKAINLLTPN